MNAANEVVVEIVVLLALLLPRGSLCAARRRDFNLLRIVQRLRVLCFVLFLFPVVHARHKQIEKLFQTAAGCACILVQLPILSVGIVDFSVHRIGKIVRVGHSPIQSAGRSFRILRHILNVVRLRRLRHGSTAGRILRGKLKIIRFPVFFEGRKLLVRQIVQILQLRLLGFPAAGNAVLYAVEEMNEGIEGIGICVRRSVLVRLHVLSVVVVRIVVILYEAREGIDRRGALLPGGLLNGKHISGRFLCGRRFPSHRLLLGAFSEPGNRCRALRRNRVDRFLRRLRRPRAGFVFLVPPSQLVVIELGAVISGIAHRVTASHCACRLHSAHAISIHIYYNTF